MNIKAISCDHVGHTNNPTFSHLDKLPYKLWYSGTNKQNKWPQQKCLPHIVIKMDYGGYMSIKKYIPFHLS